VKEDKYLKGGTKNENGIMSIGLCFWQWGPLKASLSMKITKVKKEEERAGN